MDHKELDVWKKSMDLVELVYSLTSQFPSDEKYGLVSQMRRAAVSIPSNIAEGASRKSDD
ncbi:four helix bundle protein [Seonamhaeicola sp. S2-3]|uniref:four helix bundle protein n=1 Tax=Seonamhaeicola sp. S2-3 TaxID=1936081 RepID=UPI0009FB0FD3|nr:four helix bundle protein [Seonamhaeicola sp. S2-3]